MVRVNLHILPAIPTSVATTILDITSMVENLTDAENHTPAWRYTQRDPLQASILTKSSRRHTYPRCYRHRRYHRYHRRPG